VDAIADSIDYIARLVGDAHVGLGSDWDGCVAVPPGLDAAGVAQVTHALRARGFEGAPLARIMGGNALRVLRAGLLPGGAAAGGAAAGGAAVAAAGGGA
jgi:microsomal dipeptidase-like Zn-dependent dipeptidase